MAEINQTVQGLEHFGENNHSLEGIRFRHSDGSGHFGKRDVVSMTLTWLSRYLIQTREARNPLEGDN